MVYIVGDVRAMAISTNVLFCHDTRCYVMLCVVCYAIVCYHMLRHEASCPDMPCCVMSGPVMVLHILQVLFSCVAACYVMTSLVM